MCKNVDGDSSTVCVDPCVSARRRLSAMLVPGAEKLRRAQKAPSLGGLGRLLSLSGQSFSKGAAGHPGRPWGAVEAAVVITCSSLRLCGEGAGI